MGTGWNYFLGHPLDSHEFKGHFILESGAFLALVTAIGMGGINFLTALGSKQASPLLAVWFPWLIFTALCFAVVVFKGNSRYFFSHVKNFPLLILSMGTMDTLAWVFFAVAVNRSELSITTAITESYPAIALILGLWINKEKVGKQQILGAAITILASFAIGFYS